MPAETLSITLPEDMARMIRAKVASGSYASDSEVVRDALSTLFEDDEHRLAELDAKIGEGLADIKAGRVRPIEDVRDEVLARIAVGFPDA